ncbi:putative bifunctional diguanylate cyclase/phosphodiesterase [Mangrovihabitans endophyticus]|uniref:Diguanylate cyclase (GGDEF) domain-containing protein n=1 Tax=Mangrovihabitans endophyticus TaxID=1751298 RepID=A0A8J3C4G0_9ACTN|nr:bifunctional diguanylate cyclase/phosphodiesterase [Mangrovihabitans endophyticus]GGL17482.1 hypothetical protein GCM10012284_60020 [Mangrovihabitans endophyticus]
MTVQLRWWRTFAVAGTGAAAVYTADLSPVVSVLAFAAVGAGTVWACFTGPPRHGAQPRIAWILVGSAALLFLAGVVIRPWVTARPLPWPMLADAVILPGYLLLGSFFALLLRARRSVQRHAVLDGFIVCLAAGLAAALVLALPAAAIPGRPPLQSALAGVYPLLDVVLLLLVINLTFTASRWTTSLVALLTATGLMVTGDLAYAIIGLDGRAYASPLLDTPFLLSFCALGVAALHPSVADLSRADRRPVQAWSWPRMSLLVPAVVTPFALLATVGSRSPGHRLAIAIVGAVMMILLLVRAASAVQGQVAAQLRSEHQAAHDPLTGLPNRGAVAARIERMLDDLPAGGPERVWVYLLDLDGFKWVNESWGHDCGDQLVIEVAERLRAALPDATMVARAGGDEFLLAHVGDQAGALRLVDVVRGCFVRAHTVGGTDVVISASVGIAHAGSQEDSAVTAEALMRDADTAMYRAKAEGPGRSAVFDTSMYDRVRERIELEAALRAALAQNQLHVAYQPIVRLDTGRPLGAEALVRWHHPDRGAVSPAVFIPLAEEAGLIGAIGDWVREEAVRQLARWRAEGVVADDFSMSVNVSPRQLNDPDLPMIVSAELTRHGVPARALALEMTESVMVDGSSVTTRVLFELRELGVRLLVDDFGTGFSALGYLRRFPVTGVKIDRSFVSGLGQSIEDEEIVRAVVAMSHALGLSIVAEGVETRRQRDALAATGVTQGQGWLWGAAVPAPEFRERWHAGRPAARGGGRQLSAGPAAPRGGGGQLAAGNS